MRLPPIAILVVLALAGCTVQPPPNPQAEADRIAFCKSVIDVVKPGDPKCGKYLAKLKGEQSALQSRQAALQQIDVASKCKTLIGQLMGRPVEIMVSRYPDPGNRGNVLVSYQRDDGTFWSYECNTDGQTIVWRAIDIDGLGTGPGRWREEDRVRLSTL